MSDYSPGDFHLADRVMDHKVKGAHREVEAYRLQRKAKTESEHNNRFYSGALAWLGHRLAVWGKHLEGHYKRSTQQASAPDVNGVGSDHRLLVASLLFILVALLAAWVAGPGTRAHAGEGGATIEDAAVSWGAAEGANGIPSQLRAAEGIPVKNQFPNPESWYRDTSPYAGQPLAITSSGDGMNMPE